MLNNKLLIIGASGHGKVVADIALKMKKWNEIAFLDDNDDIKETLGIEVIGKSDDASKYVDDYEIFVGIGNNESRERIQSDLEKKGATIPILIHPSAIIGKEVKLGRGTVVMAGVVVNSSTTIGKGCIINTGATVDHDNLIEDYVHISPGVNVAGTVTIGKSTWLGIGSTVNNNVSITGMCIIASGAVVINNIYESGVYVGVPARRISNEKGFDTR